MTFSIQIHVAIQISSIFFYLNLSSVRLIQYIYLSNGNDLSEHMLMEPVRGRYGMLWLLPHIKVFQEHDRHMRPTTTFIIISLRFPSKLRNSSQHVKRQGLFSITPDFSSRARRPPCMWPMRSPCHGYYCTPLKWLHPCARTQNTLRWRAMILLVASVDLNRSDHSL